MRRTYSAELVMLVTVVLWSGNFTAVKLGLREISPLAFTVVRFGIGAAVTYAIVRWREGPLRFQRADWPLLTAAAVIGITVNQLTFVGALSTTSAVNVALLIGTITLWTSIVSVIAGQERLDGAHWIGVLVGLGGVALIVTGGVPSGGEATLLGDALALGVAISWAIYSVLLRPLAGRYSPLQLSTFVTVVGTAILVPFSIPQLLTQDWSAVGPSAIGGLLYATFIALTLTNLLYFSALQRIGAARASAFIYLEPFLGVLFAVWLLGEHVTVLQLLGGVIVVAAVVVARPRPEIALADTGV
jgi:drug/metabolite transporter (DMT)-like permease